MKKFLRIYWAYATAFIKARLEYRSTCITGMFANFYCYFITYLLLAVLAWKFGDIAGWDFSELSILYGLNLVSYAVAGMMFWNSTLDLEDTIVRGRLDRHLTRPMGVLQQLVLQTFGYTFLGQIAVAGLFLVRAYIRICSCWQHILSKRCDDFFRLDCILDSPRGKLIRRALLRYPRTDELPDFDLSQGNQCDSYIRASLGTD